MFFAGCRTMRNRTVNLRPAAENPQLRIVNVDGLDLALWEWPGAIRR